MGGWVGGWVGFSMYARKLGENEAVRMSYCNLGVGGEWVGGWVGG